MINFENIVLFISVIIGLCLVYCCVYAIYQFFLKKEFSKLYNIDKISISLSKLLAYLHYGSKVRVIWEYFGSDFGVSICYN